MKFNIKRLKAERIAKGLSQADMAHEMGWSSRTPYVKRELGYIDITIEEFIKMLEILGYSSDNFHIFFTDEVPEKEHQKK